MDISPAYIKMCEKTKEIQKLRPIIATNGDYFYCKVHGFGCDLDTSIWLPRQDQLQEMMEEKNPIYLIHDFKEFCSPYWNYTISFTSMEQLWLAFVMRRRYGKIWSGTEWAEV